MNIIVGSMIIAGLKNHQIFYIMTYFFNKEGYKDFFNSDFSIPMDIAKRGIEMLETVSSELYDHLNFYTNHLNTVLFKWVLTLFSQYISPREVIRVFY